MALLHHPHEETLLRHAARRLSPSLSLAVATHLGFCPQCSAFVAQCEAVGGALLAGVTEEPLRPEALAEVLDWMETGTRPEAALPLNRSAETWPVSPQELELPKALRFCSFGPWRWVAPGMHFAHVIPPGGKDTGNLILLKAGATRELPLHEHEGIELTQVLTGRFSDHFGHYGVGDLIERAEDDLHRPVVDADAECICLIATENRLVFKGFIARLVQVWTGI